MIALWAVTNGYLDEVEVEKIKEFENRFIQHLKIKNKKLLSEIASKKELDEKIIKELEKETTQFGRVYGKH